MPTSEDVYLILGENGCIGGKLIELLQSQGKKFHVSICRNYDRESLIREVEEYEPTHVLNAAGVTGRPNVDWCEDNKLETIRSNVIGTLNVADVCAMKGIIHLLYASGCIYVVIVSFHTNHLLVVYAFLSSIVKSNS
jgi:3,5-epimerase/4-reductase